MQKVLNIRYFLHLRSTVFHWETKFMRAVLFFFKPRKKERDRVFQGGGKKKEKIKVKQIQGWPFSVKCYKQPKLTLTLVIILREITSQHDTSSKGSHSFPLNISEGGESSDTSHDKEKTTVLLKYKYFDRHLQRAHKSPKTAHFPQCNTAQMSDIWRSHSGFYHHFTES